MHRFPALLLTLALAACTAPKPSQTPADTTTVTVDSASPVQGGVIRATGVRPKTADTVTRVDTLARTDSAYTVTVGTATHYRVTHRLVTQKTVTITVTDSIVVPPPVFRPLDFALSQVPDTELGKTFNANMRGFTWDSVGSKVRQAAAKNACLWIVMPRAQISASGRQGGLFSVDSVRSWADKVIGTGFTNDSAVKYKDAICGLLIGDDYGNKDDWGGKVVTNAQVDSSRSLLHQRFPSIALGVRIGPPWITSKNLRDSLDFMLDQYREKFDPDFVRWFSTRMAQAKAWGMKYVGAVNVSDCGPTTGGGPCKPDKLLAYYLWLAQNKDVCALAGYMHDPADVAAKKAQWDSIAVVVRKTPRRSCKR